MHAVGGFNGDVECDKAGFTNPRDMLTPVAVVGGWAERLLLSGLTGSQTLWQATKHALFQAYL